MNTSTIGKLLFLFFIAITANAQSAVAKDFFEHPTHCKNLIGSNETIGESMTREFSESFTQQINLHIRQGSGVNDALKQIETKCLAKIKIS